LNFYLRENLQLSMTEIIRFAKLMLLIMRRGKFAQSGYDFAKRRTRMLSGLMPFCPPGWSENKTPGWKKLILGNELLRALIAPAAFLRTALSPTAAHLLFSDLNLAYVRNPRAGSTALSFALLQRSFPALKIFRLTEDEINFLTDVHLRKNLNDLNDRVTVFSAVRNPFARIVSVYREFIERRSTGFVFDDYLFGIIPKDLSFNDFTSRVQLIPDSLKDQHIKPQYLFFEYYQRRNIPVKVFKLEQPAELSHFLSEFGLHLEIINKSRTPYDYRLYYDKGSLAAVFNMYENDIRVFGYEQVYDDLRRFVLR
jgi:hypothetical protein